MRSPCLLSPYCFKFPRSFEHIEEQWNIAGLLAISLENLLIFFLHANHIGNSRYQNRIQNDPSARFIGSASSFVSGNCPRSQFRQSPLSIASQFVLSLKQDFTSTSLEKARFLQRNFLLARVTVPRDIGI